VKVTINMLSSGIPSSMAMRRIRSTNTAVFPDPAAAATRMFFPLVSMVSLCFSVKFILTPSSRYFNTEFIHVTLLISESCGMIGMNTLTRDCVHNKEMIIMNNKRPTMLLIMDGFGMNDETFGNAIAQANKPALDEIFSKYPMTRIDACGEAVGLPDGQMGNSEVGHLNIGAGRIVYQELTRITKDAESGNMLENERLNHAIDHVKATGGALHLWGLLSDGGVHSHINHLFALLDMAAGKGVEKIFVHGFLDGRDVPPRCAGTYVQQLEEKLTTIRNLNEIAQNRGQSLAEMALCWVLRENKVTTVLIGASRKEQITNNVKIVDHLDFSADELAAIEQILSAKN
jgi:hypothetical protein